ncbi:MAG: chorismate-binding protein [Leeuwenhoekiella sp.]
MITTSNLDDFIKHHRDQLPFVLYRKPNTSLVKGLMQEDKQVNYSERFGDTGFVMAPFDNSENAVLIPGQPTTVTLPALPKFNQKKIIDFSSEELQKFSHIALVEKALNTIKQSKLEKVVLSRKQIVKNECANPFEAFQKLLILYPTALVYLWYHPEVGTWLGATPETLLTLNGKTLKTMALAGTQVFDPNNEPVWGAKEQEEQELVTQEILSRLSQLPDLTVIKGERRNQRAGQMLHLLTPITARLNNPTFDLKKIIEALHPTPAVCGFPRELAKKFILENENYDRNFYTGFLGEINQTETPRVRNTSRNIENRAYQQTEQSSSLFVNLRCMQLLKDDAAIYVGGGITAQSSPALEWQETVNKTQTMRRVLGAS